MDPLASNVPAEKVIVTGLGTSSPSTTSRLTAGLAAGDEAAFRELHAVYFDRLFRYLLVILRGDQAAAKDALQETFLRVARHARKFNTEEELWGWLTVLARSSALDAGRKQSRYWSALKRFFTGNHSHDARSDPFHSTKLELEESLNSALAELEPLERRLLEGKYFDQCSVIELATRTGLTEKAVESRLHRARLKLRTRLTKGMNDEDA